MRILVAVKQAARLKGDYVHDGDTARAVERELNEWDAFALEAALRLREAAGEGDVVAVTVGDEDAEQALRTCLAMGADRAVRVWDSVLGGADPLALATVLAAVAGAEDPGLILCGAQSSDGANAATGVALAGLLDLPRVAVVRAIERDDERLLVERELDGGAVELLRVALPALLTIQTGIHDLRRANLRAIKQARSKPLASMSLEDLDLTPDAVRAAAGSHTLRLLEPQRSRASMIEGPPGEVAERIVEIVTGALRA
ncbi:MAG: electron transfer flavoprotein subunit beta/FixA family protein [Solirubrobacteraceae bacterium]